MIAAIIFFTRICVRLAVEIYENAQAGRKDRERRNTVGQFKSQPRRFKEL